MKLFHDSRNPDYRLPLGARRTGETVVLRLRARGRTPDRVWLRLWWADAEQRYEMTAPKGNGLFEYALTLPDEPGLMWYYFIAEKDGKLYFYGNAYDEMGGEGAKLYSTVTSDIKAEALKHDLHLLDAQVRHLGTDRNREILQIRQAFSCN